MRVSILGIACLLLAATLIWVYPAVAGPMSVDCGDLEPAPCDRAWRQVASDHADGVLALLPVTSVQVSGATASDPECGTFIIQRWVFTSAVVYDCLRARQRA